MLFKTDTFIVRLERAHFEKLHDGLVRESQIRIDELERCLLDKTELDIPVPCALDGMCKVSKEDDIIRLVQLVRKYDTKRVREIVNQKIKAYLVLNPELVNVPESVISSIKTEVKENDASVQVPKIVDMLLMFYGTDIVMHSYSNMASFKPYLLSLINEIAIFVPAYVGVEENEWDELLTSSTAGTCDESKFRIFREVNNCEITLYRNSYNRIKLSSKRQITPSIIYETWHKAVKLIKETQSDHNEADRFERD